MNENADEVHREGHEEEEEGGGGRGSNDYELQCGEHFLDRLMTLDKLRVASPNTRNNFKIQ